MTIDFQPVSGSALPRFAGIPTFMRLPHVPPAEARAAGVDLGFYGVPWDGGTTNRPGPRHGPRQLRDASTMLRAMHGLTGRYPFRHANCADLGDVAPNPVSLHDTMDRITAFVREIRVAGVTPFMAGGDHLCTLPVLRALAHDRPLGMIHFDSHTDLGDAYFGGERYTHGTPFRRAVEEGLLDPKRVVQIGIRGTMYDREDRDFADAEGIRLIGIEECFDRGFDDVMDEACEIATGPIYCSYDIDFVDPTFAPGTGTPEVGGPNSFQALEVVRGLEGVAIAGADVVEVSPPFDPSGGTAWLAVSIMFEMLCVMVRPRT